MVLQLELKDFFSFSFYRSISIKEIKKVLKSNCSTTQKIDVINVARYCIGMIYVAKGHVNYDATALACFDRSRLNDD